MAAQSKEEFVKRLEALPKHARDVHEWEGGRCEFHPLRVCTCKKCGDSGEIQCEGKKALSTSAAFCVTKRDIHTSVQYGCAEVWMTILESGWNIWVWLVGMVSRRWVWLVGGIYGYGYSV